MGIFYAYKNFIEVTDPINFDYFNKFYNHYSILNSNNSFAKGIGAGIKFKEIQPISTFNKNIKEWPNASYDKDIQYSETPFYNFDDYILHLKQFKKVI